jgi:hypothetical protein
MAVRCHFDYLDRKKEMPMRQISILAAGLLMAAISALSAPAWAQSAGAPQDSSTPTGTINARAYAPLPVGSAISVVMDENTDQYQRLKVAIEAELRGHGFLVSDDGQLVLVFYGSEVIGGHPVDRESNAPGARSLAPVPAHDATLGMLTGLNQDLFGDDQGSGPDAAANSGHQVSLSMTLTDKNSAQRLWQGSAAGVPHNADSFAATKALVPYLVYAIGRTASGEKFDMP